MNLRYIEWVYLYNMDSTWNFNTRLKPKTYHTLPLQPVYKVKSNIYYPTNKYHLIPGYIDSEENFYQCPLLASFVQVNKIKQIDYFDEEKPKSGLLKKECVMMDTIIFSKDYKQNIKKEIVISSNFENGSRPSVMTGLFDRVINTLNEYIQLGKDIDDIDFEKLTKLPPKSDPKRLSIKIVEALEFEYYDNSKRRPRHDHDSSWKEIEVRNLPKDKYLLKLIAKNLRKQCRRVRKTEFGLLLIIDSKPTLKVTGKRKKINNIKDRTYKTINLKDNTIDMKKLLKLDVYKEYNYKDRLLENITKDTNHDQLNS